MRESILEYPERGLREEECAGVPALCPDAFKRKEGGQALYTIYLRVLH